jgi:chromosome segregation ATPase
MTEGTKKGEAGSRGNQFKKHNTADTYKQLLEVDLKSGLTQVGELTRNVSQLFETVNEIAVNIEEAVVRLESLSGGLNYCRAEIKALNRQTQTQSVTLKALETKFRKLRARLLKLEIEGAENPTQ